PLVPPVTIATLSSSRFMHPPPACERPGCNYFVPEQGGREVSSRRREQRMDFRRRRAAAAVWPGDDFQQVTVQVVEVHSTSAVPVVDAAALAPVGVRPVCEAAFANPAEDPVELVLVHEEGVMLGRDLVA